MPRIIFLYDRRTLITHPTAHRSIICLKSRLRESRDCRSVIHASAMAPSSLVLSCLI